MDKTMYMEVERVIVNYERHHYDYRDQQDWDHDPGRRGHRTRSSSVSDSSGSRGNQEGHRLQWSKRWMYKHDPSYAAFRDQREQEIRDIEVRRQGEIMARAMQDSIKGAFQDNTIRTQTRRSPLARACRRRQGRARPWQGCPEATVRKLTAGSQTPSACWSRRRSTISMTSWTGRRLL